MDHPDAARQPSNNLALDDFRPSWAREIAWALAAVSADAGRTDEAEAIADAGYAIATRSFDAPHMRFNIADAHVSGLLLAGRIGEALEVAERVRQQAADLPGAAKLLGAAVAGRAALGAGRLDTACPLLGQAAAGCPLRMRPAGGTGTASRARSHSRCRVGPRRLAPRWPRSTRCDVPSGRWTMNGAWPGRG